jgi:uncharacterized alkaline shock family protein YloU
MREDRVYEAPGKVTIAPTVLTTIVRLATLDQRGVRRLVPVPPNVRGLLAGGAAEEGIFIEVVDDGVQVEVHVMADAGANMLKLGEALQNSITRAIEEMVGLPVRAINVYIDDVALPAPTKTEKE